jgi:hypothetical protein
VQELFSTGDNAMARIAEPIVIHKRGNSFQFTLNATCGLPRRVCAEWQRRSFRALPEELSNRMSVKKIAERKDKNGKIRVPGREMGGTRTFVGVIKFVRMAFKNYEAANECWLNPYRTIKEPKYKSIERETEPENPF